MVRQYIVRATLSTPLCVLSSYRRLFSMDRLFVANVERLRAEQGLSRNALARKAGMSVDTLTAWANKNVSPTLRMIPAVAAALGVEPVALLTEPPKKRARRLQENGQ